MRKTIKQLEQELEVVKNEKDNYFSKYYELKEEKEKSEINKMMNIQSEKDELSNQTRNLLEIIRWFIKPETARHPFMPDKTQRDDKRDRF